MKPMKAATCEDQHLSLLRFPLFASLKVDGIRSVHKDGIPQSSALKPIRNNHVRNTLANTLGIDGWDGELLLKDMDDPDKPGTHDFNLVSSAIMGSTGTPDFVFWVFDVWNDTRPFCVRYGALLDKIDQLFPKYKEYVKHLPQQYCESLEELLIFESEALEAGYEGVMIRTFDGKYKYGEGTLREQVLLKRKPFVDAECIVVGFEERMTNTNEAEMDNLGRTKRSTAQEGLVPAGTLGKFLVTTKQWGDFAVGCGKMTHVRAQEIWDNREDYIGKIITFKYQNHGIKDKPRLPIFKSFRDPEDLTPDKLLSI